MQLVKDISQTGLAVTMAPPIVHCKIFEDNSGALEMVRLPKMRPRTRHMAVRLHHFREYVRDGSVSIAKVTTRYQLGDLLTKPQPRELFEMQREAILQWLPLARTAWGKIIKIPLSIKTSFYKQLLCLG